MSLCTKVRGRAGGTWSLVDAARVCILSAGQGMTVKDDVVLAADMADSVTLYGGSVAQGSSYSRLNILEPRCSRTVSS